MDRRAFMKGASLILPALALPTGSRAQGSETDRSPAEWREDLRALAAAIRTKHKNPFHRVGEAEFQSAVNRLDRDIPRLSSTGIMVGFQRIAAMIGDGHTFLRVRDVYHPLPLEVFWFGDELRIIRASVDHRRLLGARIVGFSDVDIAEANQRIQAIVAQGENRWYVLNESANQLMKAEPLRAFNIASTARAVSIRAEQNGQSIPDRVVPLAPGSKVPLLDIATPLPLYLQRPDESLWFQDIGGSGTVYANFRNYDGLAERAEALIAHLKAKGTRRLIVDLRHNRGGNYTLAREHLIYKLQFMPEINRPGGLFVITGRKTFSAAMTNATDLRQETDAILIGEPTGARPNGYQEIVWTTLPHSKLALGCSILHYRFQSDDDEAVMPDVRIDPDWASYRQGRDNVLEWILKQ